MPGRRREGRTPGGPPGRPAGSGRRRTRRPPGPRSRGTCTGSARPPGSPDVQGADALLIRPDGFIAWATADRIPLETALTRWFG
ncbi:hypothetical protein [Streptomyces sp. NPDC001833]|uniref:aromatic-ring hydroxylase C-terminal domain-containing protein n=1 Tax=Streptomyces sp. NPDC001833 TaxID=3154658 RepID=UPI00332B0620